MINAQTLLVAKENKKHYHQLLLPKKNRSHRGPDVDREFRASDSPRTVDGESDTEMEQPEDADD